MASVSYRIAVCRHHEERFVEIFLKYINHECRTFECDCDTYGNHKNLVIFCEQCAVFNFQAAQIHSCSCGNLAANPFAFFLSNDTVSFQHCYQQILPEQINISLIK